MPIEIEERLAELAARLLAAEDELAIRNLITRYGLAADCGDAEAAVACHTEDARYTVSAPGAGRDDTEALEDLSLQGHQAIREMLSSAMHRSLLPNCAHTAGPVTVELNGNSARATGYSRLYRNPDDNLQLMRLAINEWTFARVNGHWLIASRESRVLGEDQAQQLLHRAAFTP